MATYINGKYNLTCSRASLSRWLDKLGFERRIIRRGNRSRDKDIPPLSEADMMRLLSDPSPDTEIMNLPPNSKKARYAWLAKTATAEDAEPKRKRKAKGASQAEPDPPSTESSAQPAQPASSTHMDSQDHLAGSIMQSAGMTTPPNYSTYHPSTYISPYRTITPNGGLVVGGPPPPLAGQMLSQNHMPPVDPRLQHQGEYSHG